MCVQKEVPWLFKKKVRGKEIVSEEVKYIY